MLQPKIEEKPTISFVLSLLAGIFILLGALVWFWIVNVGFGMMQSMMGSMMGLVPSQPVPAFSVWALTPFWAVGLVSGIIVTFSAVMHYSRPKESTIWGVLILVFSIVSIVGAMGGFLAGLILGIIGGAFAIAHR